MHIPSFSFLFNLLEMFSKSLTSKTKKLCIFLLLQFSIILNYHLTFFLFSLSISVKPSAVRNCTIRSYIASSSSSSSSSAAAAYNSSSNNFDSLPYSQNSPNNDIQSFGIESNYINAQYLKERKVSKDKKNSTSSSSIKFNQNKRDLINSKNNSINGRSNVERNDNVVSVNGDGERGGGSENLDGDGGGGIVGNEYKVKILKRRKRNKFNFNSSSSTTPIPDYNSKNSNNNKQFYKKFTKIQQSYRDIFILNETVGNLPATINATTSRIGVATILNKTSNWEHQQQEEEKPHFSYLKTNLPKSSDTINSNKYTSSTSSNSNNNIQYQELYETPSIIELECIAGYDGGLPQHFQLEGYDVKSKKIRLNLSSIYNDLPLFRVDLTGNLKMTSFKNRKAIIILF
jgi:hypothetical protein